MRRHWTLPALLALVGALWLAPEAQAQQQQQPLINRGAIGSGQAARHNPFSGRSIRFAPGGFRGRVSPPTTNPRTNFFGVPGYYYSDSYRFRRYPYDRWWVDPWYGYYDYYGYDTWPPYFTYWQPPPIRAQLFGPQAAASYAGVYPSYGATGGWSRRYDDSYDANYEAVVNRQARARRLIAQGDVHFAAGRWADAQRVYRRATEIGRDLPEAHFRHGQVLLALRRYSAASEAFQRGIELAPALNPYDYHFASLYGGNESAFRMHESELYGAATEQPTDPDRMFLVALWLYFGEQPAEALAYFDRAQQLGIDGYVVSGFQERLAAREDARQLR